MVVSAENSYRILVCHSDPATIQAASTVLREAGFFVVVAHQARQAVDRMASVLFDLVILGADVEALGKHSLVHHMRMLNSHVPIMILGGPRRSHGREQEQQRDVEQADYFLPYPYAADELVALVHQALAKTAAELERPNRSVRVIGGLALDHKRKLVTVNGEAVKLTPSEYNILHFLVEHPGRVYSADEIYQAVWQQEPMNSNNVVTVHICHIREKIEANPKCPTYLKVLWGKGYYIDAKEDDRRAEPELN